MRLVLALRRKVPKPLILGLARDFVCPSSQEILSQRPHPVASMEASSPKWPGCHLKVAKMLFPMKDTDLLRNPFWTELRVFLLEQWRVLLENRKRVRVDSEGSWMKRQQPSSAKKVSCWNRFADKLIGRLD